MLTQYYLHHKKIKLNQLNLDLMDLDEFIGEEKE